MALTALSSVDAVLRCCLAAYQSLALACGPCMMLLQATEVMFEPLSPEQRGEHTVNVDGENAGFSPVLVRCLNRVLLIVA